MSLQVVYVEDNYPSLLLIQRLLHRAGHTVHGADDAVRGLALIEEVQPDIILLDINLPDMNGHEIARELRCRPAFEQTPLIAITASSYEVYHRKASDFDAYIAKPVRYRELIEIIENMQAKLGS